MQHIQPIPILLHDEYAPRCYVQYYSKLETMDLGEITQLTDLTMDQKRQLKKFVEVWCDEQS